MSRTSEFAVHLDTLNDALLTAPGRVREIHAASASNHIRPRYAFVRNLEWERLDAEHRSWHDARYDIVDNMRGAECVMARGVHYKSALAIVGALNMMEESLRLGGSNGDGRAA
jgi:hypothetical protein